MPDELELTLTCAEADLIGYRQLLDLADTGVHPVDETLADIRRTLAALQDD